MAVDAWHAARAPCAMKPPLLIAILLLHVLKTVSISRVFLPIARVPYDQNGFDSRFVIVCVDELLESLEKLVFDVAIFRITTLHEGQ